LVASTETPPERPLRTMSEHCCVDCGQELVFFGLGEPPRRCEECIPETGPESPFLSQVATNLHNLRLAMGIDKPELARRAAIHVDHVSKYEHGEREPGVIRALHLAHSLASSIDRLTERTYWNPGEVAPTPGARRAAPERLSGFFSTLPANIPLFEAAAPRGPLANRREAAEVFGRNVREARERRHLIQVSLARAVGLSKSGLSLIERGIHETTIGTLISLARALEVTPEFLLGGIGAWKPLGPLCAPPRCGGAKRHEAHGLDDPVARHWSEGRTAREIAASIGTSPQSVSAIVQRLRERGRPLSYRRPALTAADHGARRRRQPRLLERPCEEIDDAAQEVAEATLPEPASLEDVKAGIGANVALHRHAAGLTFRQLADATETDAAYLNRIEKGKQDFQLSLLVRLAGSLNVRCGALTCGLSWEPGSAAFRLDTAAPRPATHLKRLGRNVARARRRAGISQAAAGGRVSMHGCEVSDFERADRNFRCLALVMLAGSLEVDVAELFSGVADWNIRPLPPPEYGPGDRRPTKAERDVALIRLWRQGKTEREIGEVLDIPSRRVASAIAELRNSGVALPYRRPPLNAAQAAARRRRAPCAPGQPAALLHCDVLCSRPRRVPQRP
jgi:transcriptional regulator with XRE-family HTH domain/DNA-binding CsgD family transcriptional regulator